MWALKLIVLEFPNEFTVKEWRKDFPLLLGEITEENGVANSYLESYGYGDEYSELEIDQEKEKESNKETTIWVIVIALGIMMDRDSTDYRNY